ncbi:hypothetical protein BT69DRAFT_879615 [Atractiella rhizophila]|nr:hypothetical protein BT69DRAFT_879615 [Atractiella rhizophila]
MTGVTHQIAVSDMAGDLIFDPPSVNATPGDLVEFVFMYVDWGSALSNSTGGSGKNTDGSGDALQMRDWAVTQSDFWTPCTSLKGGFDSGFWVKGNSKFEGIDHHYNASSPFTSFSNSNAPTSVTSLNQSGTTTSSPPTTTIVGTSGGTTTNGNSTTIAGRRTYSIMIVDNSPLWFYCRLNTTEQTACKSGMVGAINAPTTGMTYTSFINMAKGTGDTPTPDSSSTNTAASTSIVAFIFGLMLLPYL